MCQVTSSNSSYIKEQQKGKIVRKHFFLWLKYNKFEVKILHACMCNTIGSIYTFFFQMFALGDCCWLVCMEYTQDMFLKKYTTFFLPRKNLHLELNVVATN